MQNSAEPPTMYEIDVKDPKRYVNFLLNHFKDQGYLLEFDTIKIDKSTKEKLKSFQISETKRGKGLFKIFKWKETKYKLTGEFVKIFSDYLNAIDVKKCIISLVVWNNKLNILSCYDNFTCVFAKIDIPEELCSEMIDSGIVAKFDSFENPEYKNS